MTFTRLRLILGDQLNAQHSWFDSNSLPALVGFMLNAMALDKATLTATYVR